MEQQETTIFIPDILDYSTPLPIHWVIAHFKLHMLPCPPDVIESIARGIIESNRRHNFYLLSNNGAASNTHQQP